MIADAVLGDIDALPVAAYATDATGRITSYNKAAVRLWGRTPAPGEMWCGSWRIRSTDGGLLPHDRCPMAIALKEDRPVRGVEAFAERPDGSMVRFRAHPSPIYDAQGRLAGAINLLTAVDAPAPGNADVQDGAAAYELWSRELLAMQSAVAAAGSDIDCIMAAVVEGALRVVPHADGAIVEMRDGDELVYRAASGTCADKVGLRLRLATSLSGRCILTGEVQVCGDTEVDPRVDREACRRVGVRSMIVVPLSLGGACVGVLKVCSGAAEAFGSRDLLTTRLLAGPIMMGLASAAHADALRARIEADRRFAATFDQAAVGIAHVAPDGRFLLVNDRFCEIAGHGRAAMLAGGFQQITHPDDLDIDLENVAELLAGRRTHYSMEKRYIRADGSAVWINLTGSLVRHADGSPDFFVAVIEDISARKSAEDAATHDGLTGLSNRRGLLRKLGRELELHRLAGQPMAVAYIDLDGFKAVNDGHGHDEGDRCLVGAAKAMRAALRAGDLIARIGGDEFVALLPMTSDDAVGPALSRLRNAVAAVGTGQPWTISASVGAVVVQPGASGDAQQILAAADRLMYDAKRARAEWPEIAVIRTAG